MNTYTVLLVKDVVAWQFGDKSQLIEKLGEKLTQEEVDKVLKPHLHSGADRVILEEKK
jgi:hypothetical protein